MSVEAHGDDTDLAFGFRVLDPGQHPLDVLLGFRAPAAWSGLGVICFGWASPVADGLLDAARHTTRGPRPSEHPDRVRVRVTAGSKRMQGVRVVVSGAGVKKAARSNRQGMATLRINPKRTGLVTITADERNRTVCGPKRIGVVGVFLPPLTG